jgi:hypothetical protein
MKYAVCPNNAANFHCKGTYIAGGEIFDPHRGHMVKVPAENFEKCLNCGTPLVECIGSCGCVGKHSEKCRTYMGPD